MSIQNQMQIEYLHPRELKDYHRQLRTPNNQIEKTKRIIADYH